MGNRTYFADQLFPPDFRVSLLSIALKAVPEKMFSQAQALRRSWAFSYLVSAADSAGDELLSQIPLFNPAPPTSPFGYFR